MIHTDLLAVVPSLDGWRVVYIEKKPAPRGYAEISSVVEHVSHWGLVMGGAVPLVRGERLPDGADCLRVVTPSCTLSDDELAEQHAQIVQEAGEKYESLKHVQKGYS